MGGNELESTMTKAAELLAFRQLCRIYKVPERWIQTPCDFFGYTIRGRAMLIECKMKSGKSLSIGSDVKPHQWMALKEAQEAGCLSILLWQHNGKIAIINPFYIDSIRFRKGDHVIAKSINWDRIEEYRIYDANHEALADGIKELYESFWKQIPTQRDVPKGHRGRGQELSPS